MKEEKTLEKIAEKLRIITEELDKVSKTIEETSNEIKRILSPTCVWIYPPNTPYKKYTDTTESDKEIFIRTIPYWTTPYINTPFGNKDDTMKITKPNTTTEGED